MRNIDLEVLRIVARHSKPIGQGTINQLLRQHGYTVSTPTVGRILQELEFQGLLEKRSVDGRLITPRGRKILHEWDAEARLRGSGEALLDTLKREDKRNILDLLYARQVIESETAALAAQYASPSAIRTMENLLDRQEAVTESGGLAIDEDVLFHVEIARASQNAVLQSLVALLRNHKRYNYIITSMRTVVGTSLVVDHQAILDAIRAHDPDAARAAMADHLKKLADDLNRFRRKKNSRTPTAVPG